MQRTVAITVGLLILGGLTWIQAHEVPAKSPAEKSAPKAQAHANHGPARHRGLGPMHGHDDKFEGDHDIIFFLLEHRSEITRKVTLLENGVETLTESKNLRVAEKIREHVASMYDRVENNQPIHRRDPLFREIFQYTDQIKMKTEKTENGIRVIETSTDPYMAKLIRAHANVVSAFIQFGHQEVRKNHPVPNKD